jgi:hypothetical protein
MVFDIKALAQKLARDGIQHFRRKFDIDIPAALNSLDNPIVINSDVDEDGSNAASDDVEEAADQPEEHDEGFSHSLLIPTGSRASCQGFILKVKLTSWAS